MNTQAKNHFVEDALVFCKNILDNYDSPVLLLPTETVYGLFCNYDDPEAKNKIFEMKNRDKNKRLQLIAPNVNCLEKHGVDITMEVELLIQKFCPGPITIISNTLNNHTEKTIGFRIPNSPFLLNLMRKTKLSLAATSANISGDPPASSIHEALEMLKYPPDAVVDAGILNGEPSTVVDMTGSNPLILREGPISMLQIKETLCLQD